ncbi:hypothetical protein NtB2_00195 [Lactococcus termiticola]|uniref:Uncharacterized protein n=1 Tax=Lactococcus termiticola TaxID=2169526 RepID=A0A2R5HIZ3_9LACT|nr:hypothetical protein NtB2_00195 [Lactococcus termiticola]
MASNHISWTETALIIEPKGLGSGHLKSGLKSLKNISLERRLMKGFLTNMFGELAV